MAGSQEHGNTSSERGAGHIHFFQPQLFQELVQPLGLGLHAAICVCGSVREAVAG